MDSALPTDRTLLAVKAGKPGRKQNRARQKAALMGKKPGRAVSLRQKLRLLRQTSLGCESLTYLLNLSKLFLCPSAVNGR